MSKTAAVIRHLAFEDLGCFESPLTHAGYEVHYYDVGLQDLKTLDPLGPDLLIVLGGPIGAYEDDIYPFLLDEERILQTRLRAQKPTLGICLGAQLIARALGSRVYPGPAKEIGFAPITLTDAGKKSCLSAFEASDVLHWHGDTFDLPQGATLLASTTICTNQAFSYGNNAIAFQFHPEAGGSGFERWLIGHTFELNAAKKDIATLRDEYTKLATTLKTRAETCMGLWLNQIA